MLEVNVLCACGDMFEPDASFEVGDGDDESSVVECPTCKLKYRITVSVAETESQEDE